MLMHLHSNPGSEARVLVRKGRSALMAVGGAAFYSR